MKFKNVIFSTIILCTVIAMFVGCSMESESFELPKENVDIVVEYGEEETETYVEDVVTEPIEVETEPEIVEEVEEVTEPVTEEPTEEVVEQVTEVATENVEKPTEEVTEPVEKPTEPKKEESKKEEKKKTFNLSDYERQVVECIVMGESGGEPHNGQVLVAQCILNACLKDDIQPSRVRTKYQYSGWNSNPSESVKKAVSAVFDDGYKVTNEPILYFYSPKYCSSKWHESQRFVIEVGGHRFFAERN